MYVGNKCTLKAMFWGNKKIKTLIFIYKCIPSYLLLFILCILFILDNNITAYHNFI